MKYSEFGKRMKRYEEVSKNYLTRRTPVIIRLDGKAFHTLCKGLNKPFDIIFNLTMQKTMLYLCENIQGCVFGYTQSDEITLVLCDYQTLESGAWFDYNVQKICSISASMASAFFNSSFKSSIKVYEDSLNDCITAKDTTISQEDINQSMDHIERLKKAASKLAVFDARCFNIPIEEVVNNVLWRQMDCHRNSILSVGLATYGHKLLNKMSCNDIKEKLKNDNIDYDELPNYFRVGASCVKNEQGKWYIDFDMPYLMDDRDYLERRIHFE